jgi:thimet oligopeptidase
MKEFVALKRKETGNPNITTIDPWDSRYYRTMVKKQRYEVDENALQPYFPLQQVLDGMFNIYQTLLGVKFEKLDNAPVWNKDVIVYAVRDVASGRIMSHFYMDIFPREGKYGHAAAFGLIPGHRLPDGTYQGHVSSIVANFTQPTADKPSLLRHSEVETMFHEFGHIMHGVLTRSRYGSFAGTAVKRDFVEALSQIFENWVWDKDMLRKMAIHWKTKQPIPENLLDKLVSSRLANIGTVYQRQVQMASTDIAYYSMSPAAPKDVKAVETWNRIYKQITGMEVMTGTYFIASFNHLMSGYDAGYYSYLWSEVFAHDMFSRFKKAGLMSSSVGMELRHKILEKGGMQEPMDLLVDFLGRQPNSDAFLRNNGILSSKG